MKARGADAGRGPAGAFHEASDRSFQECCRRNAALGFELCFFVYFVLFSYFFFFFFHRGFSLVPVPLVLDRHGGAPPPGAARSPRSPRAWLWWGGAAPSRARGSLTSLSRSTSSPHVCSAEGSASASGGLGKSRGDSAGGRGRGDSPQPRCMRHARRRCLRAGGEADSKSGPSLPPLTGHSGPVRRPQHSAPPCLLLWTAAMLRGHRLRVPRRKG